MSATAKDDAIIAEGVVLESFRGDVHACEVMLGKTKLRVLAKRSGRLNKLFLRLLPGDRVRVEVNGYDPTRGRVVERLSGAST